MALFAGLTVWALTSVAPAAAAEGPITYMGCLTGDSNVAAASTVGTNSCLGLATVGAEGAGTGLDGAGGSPSAPTVSPCTPSRRTTTRSPASIARPTGP